MWNFRFTISFPLDAPVEELEEKDAIPLGEREESLDLELPAQKVLTTPSVRKMASDHKVTREFYEAS